MTGRNPRLNASGCSDPTAYEALKPIIQEDAGLERKVHSVIKTLKLIVDWAGFEFIKIQEGNSDNSSINELKMKIHLTVHQIIKRMV